MIFPDWTIERDAEASLLFGPAKFCKSLPAIQRLVAKTNTAPPSSPMQAHGSAVACSLLTPRHNGVNITNTKFGESPKSGS